MWGDVLRLEGDPDASKVLLADIRPARFGRDVPSNRIPVDGGTVYWKRDAGQIELGEQTFSGALTGAFGLCDGNEKMLIVLHVGTETEEKGELGADLQAHLSSLRVCR